MKSKTLQEQIANFYKETGYRLEVKDGKPYYSGSLAPRHKKITNLPDNLVVGGSLNLIATKIVELPDNLVVGRNLDLRHTTITKLPQNLVVGGSLSLNATKITKLPDNLIVGGFLGLATTNISELPENLVVGGGFDLVDTKITKLPENLVVGGFLDLCGTKITKLPDNLVVGAWLDFNNPKITKLPENLIVGGWVNLGGTKITKLPKNLVVGGSIYGISTTPITPALSEDAKKKLQKIGDFLEWNVGDKTYIKTDGIFSVVDSHKGNVWVSHRIGTNETLYVVTDGEGHYAHGNTLKEAKADLIYKINDRNTSSYENLSLDNELSFEEAIAMYRTITGACSVGTRDFVENRLAEPHKKKYTIKEIIDLTDGEYGSESLKEFFKVSNR